MTAPKLPEDVERALDDVYVVEGGWPHGNTVHGIAALRAAIAAHVAPPVSASAERRMAFLRVDKPPVSASFDAALAGLDVEAVERRDNGTHVYEIVGLDDVRAAHRAEVERAVAERDAAVALLSNAITRVQSCITRSAELEKVYADGGYTESAAIYRRQREEDDALLMRMDAAIRARGAS